MQTIQGFFTPITQIHQKWWVVVKKKGSIHT